MRCKSLLLGGAIALVASGAAFAQGATTSDQNSKPAAQSQQSTDSAKTPAKRVTHRVLHHVSHRVQLTASVHMRATPAERVETNDLNRDQLYSAQYRSGPQPPRNMQGEATYYRPEPGQNTGSTPVRRIPNGIPFQAVTPAGGRADTSSLNQVHSR